MQNLKKWLSINKKGLSSLFIAIFIIYIIYFFGYWEVIFLIFIKFGLGIKLTGIKTLAGALIKIGGKKALLYSTIGMLFKRYIIDLISKFFIKHSVKRYKNNLIVVLKMKMNDIKNASIIKKIRITLTTFLSIPIIYIFWSKFLSVTIQKLAYAFIYPLFSLLFSMLTYGFNFISTGIIFIVELFMLSFVIDFMKKFEFSNNILNKINNFILYLWNFVVLFNKLLEKYNISPRVYLVKVSKKINKFLEDNIDKEINFVEKLTRNNFRFVNTIEEISLKRYEYKKERYNKLKNKDKKKKFFKFIKDKFKKKKYSYKTDRKKYITKNIKEIERKKKFQKNKNRFRIYRNLPDKKIHDYEINF